MARATRVTLFEREVRERLSTAAVEILLGRAQVLSEGRRAAGQGAFFGSTMLTLDLSQVGELIREACDPELAHRVALLMTADPRIGRRVRQIAEREAARLAGGALRPPAMEVRVRAEGSSVYIDVDLEEPA